MCLSIKAGRAAHSFATSVTSVDLNLFVQGLAGCSRHRSCSLILQSWNWQRALSKWAWICWNQDSGHESWIRIERRSSLFQEWCTFIAPGRNLLGNAPELQSKAESVTSVEVELVAQRGSFFTEASPSPSHSSPSSSPSASSSSCLVLMLWCQFYEFGLGFVSPFPQSEPRWQLPAAKLLLTASVPKRYHTADAEIGGSVWSWRTCMQSKEIDWWRFMCAHPCQPQQWWSRCVRRPACFILSSTLSSKSRQNGSKWSLCRLRVEESKTYLIFTFV